MAAQEVGGELRADIQRFTDASRKDANQLARETLAGTQSAQRMMRPDESFEAGLGGDISAPSLSKAIQSRSMQRFDRDMQDLKAQVNYQSLNKKFKRLGEAAELVAAENEHNARVRQMRYQERQNKKRARGALISSILGVGGAIAGAAVGGAPGAMIGSQAGQAAGGLLGGG